jgi:curved DNA-binding protein CbpA
MSASPPRPEDIERAYRALALEPGATPLEVRRAYRRLAREWHPDRFAQDPARRRITEERMKAINDAYSTLRALGPTEFVRARRERRAAASERDAGTPPVASPPGIVFCLACRAAMNDSDARCPECGLSPAEALAARRETEIEERDRHRDERRQMRRSRWERRFGPLAEALADGVAWILWAAYALVRLFLPG